MNYKKSQEKVQNCPVYYPAFINLKNKKTVVAGGGNIAERKAMSLLKAGAEVTIISPEITNRLKKKASEGRIIHIRRKYRKGDLRDCFLAIAATDDRKVNELIASEAECLVNVVDTPDLCNFIVPSAVMRGPLTIAISTSGVSPALSRTIRKEIEKIYSVEFARFLRCMQNIRHNAKIKIEDSKARTAFLKAAASGDVIRTLRNKGVKTAVGIIRKELNQYCRLDKGDCHGNKNHFSGRKKS